MNFSPGLRSFIHAWWIFAILSALPWCWPMATRADVRATLFPRRPQADTWAVLALRRLPARQHAYRVEVRDRKGGPISAVSTRGRRVILLPVAFIKSPTGRVCRLDYRITGVQQSQTAHWHILRVTIHRSKPVTTKSYLLVMSHRAARRWHRQHVDGLRLALGSVRRMPQVAMAAFGGCILGRSQSRLVRPSLLLRLLSAGVPIYQFSKLKPAPVGTLAWRPVKCFGYSTGWMLSAVSPPAARPLTLALQRLRLPPLSPPSFWKVIAIICGGLGVVAPFLAFVAAGRRKTGLRIGAMFAASGVTAIIAILWMGRSVPIDTIRWNWRQCTGHPDINYSVRWQVVRALVPTRFNFAGISALPSASSPGAWRRLHTTIYFSRTPFLSNRIIFSLPKGAAAVIRTQTLRISPANAAPPPNWLMFSHGRLHQSDGTSLGMDRWMLQQKRNVRRSIRAWLLLGRSGFAVWYVAAGRELLVKPLVTQHAFASRRASRVLRPKP